MLPPFGWGEAAANWQFAPVVTGFSAVVAAAYLWGALRVRRRHPRRPWPVRRTILFLLGPGSSFVTGHVLTVDGGMAVR